MVKIKKIAFLRSSRNFAKDLEEPRSDKLYSSGNGEVKKKVKTLGNGVLGALCAIPTLALILKLLNIFKALDGDVLYAEFYDRIINQPQESVYQTVTDGMNLLKNESAVLQISEGSLKVKFIPRE